MRDLLLVVGGRCGHKPKALVQSRKSKCSLSFSIALLSCLSDIVVQSCLWTSPRPPTPTLHPPPKPIFLPSPFKCPAFLSPQTTQTGLKIGLGGGQMGGRGWRL